MKILFWRIVKIDVILQNYFEERLNSALCSSQKEVITNSIQQIFPSYANSS
jgi:hypothetical protein